eukprot:g43391.t1
MGRRWHAVSASLAIADDECLHGRRRQGSIGATGQLQGGATAGELTPCQSRPTAAERSSTKRAWLATLAVDQALPRTDCGFPYDPNIV